jgi:hypothetical protein
MMTCQVHVNEKNNPSECNILALFIISFYLFFIIFIYIVI